MFFIIYFWKSRSWYAAARCGNTSDKYRVFLFFADVCFLSFCYEMMLAFLTHACGVCVCVRERELVVPKDGRMLIRLSAAEMKSLSCSVACVSICTVALVKQGLKLLVYEVLSSACVSICTVALVKQGTKLST